ncbi:HTH-type transcriptional regulator Xre [Clostridium oryzae]|uniref:HTH-type transcriptional regulator Xre n=2 Tax=Clostridium oryzae TaxID=1450648 RepID=A0A1V4IGJ5_9CLOT|nr:HTH-type transcriptional regulator Xre [Clostridium oryzae]
MFTLGSRIKFLRTNSNLSLDELSSILSTAKSTLSRIENDKVSPSSDILLSISRFFGVSTDWLLTGEDYSSNSCNNKKSSSKYFSLLEIYESDEYKSDDSYIKIASEIGDRIWYLMEQFKFSSQSLSQYINKIFSPFFSISSEEIISFHYGKKIPSKENLFILSKVFNVTDAWILVGDSINSSAKNNNEILDFELGKRIKICFDQISLPLDIKAKAIGITVKDIFDYQYGYIPEKCILEKIAYFCNVSFQWLFSGKSENSNLSQIHTEFKLSNEINIQRNESNSYNDILPLLSSVPDELIDEIKKYIEFRISYLKYEDSQNGIINSKSS